MSIPNCRRECDALDDCDRSCLPYYNHDCVPPLFRSDAEVRDRRIAATRLERDFLAAVLDELNRAREKFPNEEGSLSDTEWLTVLVEEVGEAARAMQDETDARLVEELVQVAAMAMRWTLSIPHGRKGVPWDRETSPRKVGGTRE